MSKRLKRCFVVVFIGGLVAVCFLPALFDARAEILPVKTYTAADGLPRDAVWKVRQDARGFLWFCTSEGLVRFDGYSFKLYGKEEGLPLRGAVDFLQARDGTYWIGTKAGLMRFNPGGVPGQGQQIGQGRAMFTFIEMEPLPPQPKFGREVNQIYEDPQGTIWVTMEDGLNKLVEEQGRTFLRRIDLPNSNKLGYLPMHDMLKDRRGNLWVGTDHGPQHNYSTLYQIRPDGKIGRHDILLGAVNALLEAKDGTIWMGMSGQRMGLCRLAEQAPKDGEILSRCYSQKDGLPSAWINSLRQTSDGTIWAGTAAGAVRFRPDFSGDKPDFEVFRGGEGVCDRDVLDLSEDHDGNLWISSGCGATKFQRNGFSRYTESDGLNAVSVFSIFNDGSGKLIVATIDRTRDLILNVFDGRRFTQIEPNTPPGTNHGWAWGQIIVNSRAGDWWIPTEAGILYRFSGVTDIRQLARAKPKAYAAKEGFTDTMVAKLYEDRRGDVWISTSYKDKLLRWDDRINQITDISSLPDSPKNISHATSFAEDRPGNLWMGTYQGTGSSLTRYRDGKFRVFTKADGLPDNDRTDNLMMDRKGRLWFGTKANGVGRIDDPTAEPLHITWYNRSNGLSTNRVESLIEDQWGRIYIGTKRGVDCLTPETGQVRSFTTADGLPKGQIYVSARDTQGTLWFASDLGIARYSPGPPRPNQPPTIFLTGVRVAGVAQQVSEIGDLTLPELKLNPSQTNVTLQFLSPSATSDPHIRYQYKLEGRQDWSIPTDQRSVDFANLSAGSYRFLVRAVNADGIHSDPPAGVSFTVATPIWQRWWFIALSLAVIGGLTFAAYRYRVAQLLAMERMRSRIATDLHDEVGSSLSQIAILSEVARQNLRREEKANQPMEKVATTSREALDAMSDIVW
ncbi:MAG TPA: two-component regulator propeller domain-containing protein, partial [Blastocatellia bacterium]|nr:two-component regulator propeller domain-containing protein [Blastocatellia bacterium]